MTDPLLVTEVDDESRNQFNNLMEAMEDITTFDPDREEGSYEALNQRIHQEVTDQPILARIISWAGVSLLSVACSNLNLDTSHHVIKSLIEAYPSALIGPPGDDWPIDMIAHHPRHYVLMPWIAANYTWVLDNERCIQAVFALLRMYAQRGRTSCTSTTIKDFFEAYPEAFTLQDTNGDNVLHKILRLHDNYRIECDVDLFKWMAERCPSNYLCEMDSDGYTPLHLACNSLSNHKGRDSGDICKYLLVKCPGTVSVRRFGDGVLPIHILQDSCRYRLVREVVVCLLRECPDSFDMPAKQYAVSMSPSSIPFIQSIKSVLDGEKELRETAVSLTYTTSSLTKAVSCTNDQLIRSSSTVYDSWANSFINVMEDNINLISVKVRNMCNEGRESDD